MYYNQCSYFTKYLLILPFLTGEATFCSLGQSTRLAWVGNLKQRVPITGKSSNFKSETHHYVVELPKYSRWISSNIDVNKISLIFLCFDNQWLFHVVHKFIHNLNKFRFPILWLTCQIFELRIYLLTFFEFWDKKTGRSGTMLC